VYWYNSIALLSTYTGRLKRHNPAKTVFRVYSCSKREANLGSCVTLPNYNKHSAEAYNSIGVMIVVRILSKAKSFLKIGGNVQVSFPGKTHKVKKKNK
jgi:hypothetical protein